MTIEEANESLKVDTYSSYFNVKFNLYTKLSLIRLKETFTKYLFIPKDDLYGNISYSKFFSVLFYNKSNILDINQIKLDIINNVPDIIISFKYLEPLEVVNEIKEKIEEDILFLDNKLYSLKELSVLLNMTTGGIHYNKVLNKINIKKNVYAGNFYYGKDLNTNLTKILQHSKLDTLEKSAKMVHIKKLADKAKIDIETIYFRVGKKQKIFGVNITYFNKDGGIYNYIKKEDFDKILENKKYYIETSKIKDLLCFKDGTLSNLIKYYSIINQKKILINNKYIKKETVNNLVKTISTFKNDFNKYIDDLYVFISENETNDYLYNDIIRTLVYPRRSYFLEKCSIKLNNGFIDKNSVLKILDYVKSNSRIYKKSKQQGETNG